MSPDVGEEGWVPLDDPLARIPELVERLRDLPHMDCSAGHRGDSIRCKGCQVRIEAADALEAAQKEIQGLRAEIERLTSG